MPRAAAVVWTLTPLHSPSALMIADFRPREIPCVMTKVISGPGAKVRATDAPRKQSMDEEVIGLLGFLCFPRFAKQSFENNCVPNQEIGNEGHFVCKKGLCSFGVWSFFHGLRSWSFGDNCVPNQEIGNEGH
jgi:hypothetical protein